jgi:hypothetical protein
MVRGCKSGDYRLQGKIHPRDFDYTKNTHLDLPVDPKFKGKSMDDVLLMRRHGHLAVERFIPATRKRISKSSMRSRTRTRPELRSHPPSLARTLSIKLIRKRSVSLRRLLLAPQRRAMMAKSSRR